MTEPNVPDEILDAIVAQQTGLSLKQVKFLRLVRRDGVQIRMTEEAKKDPKFQELVVELNKLHETGVIPYCEVVPS